MESLSRCVGEVKWQWDGYSGDSFFTTKSHRVSFQKHKYKVIKEKAMCKDMAIRICVTRPQDYSGILKW